ncbi:cell wall-binding repeat-containing protein [Kallipyga massiliensis]|uniref:cell wall-binding repeat-containing protein n=1 Tax=Kallipyga massiliensis TaxID=1472764 RepID=UPI0004B777B2|nr:cell wall-binding repeat-containing protein [Kallipyga massiliensis]
MVKNWKKISFIGLLFFLCFSFNLPQAKAEEVPDPGPEDKVAVYIMEEERKDNPFDGYYKSIEEAFIKMQSRYWNNSSLMPNPTDKYTGKDYRKIRMVLLDDVTENWLLFGLGFDITLESSPGNHFTIQSKYQGEDMIWVTQSSTLTLKNVTVDGQNKMRCLWVDSNKGEPTSKLILEDGARVINGYIGPDANTKYGAGIYVQKNSEFVMNGGEVSNNAIDPQAKGNLGGGIALVSGKVTINGGRISDNKANYGGGIYINNRGTLEINGGEISKNNAAYMGGGIYLNAPMTMTAGTFKANHAKNGGGIAVFTGSSNPGKAMITGGSFIENQADQSGGAIFTNVYDYADPASAQKYQNISLNNSVVFKDNQAEFLAQPPQNADDFTNLLFNKESTLSQQFTEAETSKVYQISVFTASSLKSLLNNYDINYQNKADNPVIMYLVGFDPNGGSLPETSDYPKAVVANEEITLLKGATKDNFTFDYWKKISGDPKPDQTKYPEDGKATITGPTIFQAQWKEKEKPVDPPVNPPVNPPIDPDTPPTVDREDGEDRIDTSVIVSKKHYAKARTVIIARNDLYPDALTASVLAKVKDAPILLTPRHVLDPRVAGEIRRLGATEIIIVGGKEAISLDVEKALAAFDSDRVQRLDGDDRYETATLVAREVFKLVDIQGKAIVTTGENWPDALSASAFGSKENHPILLVRSKMIDPLVQKTIHDLSIGQVYLVGGDDAVSDSVAKQLPKIIVRLAGSNRYGTAKAVAEYGFVGSKGMYLASGEVFADALIIGPVAGKREVPILLTRDKELAPETKAYLEGHKPDWITIVGGGLRISHEVEKELSK